MFSEITFLLTESLELAEGKEASGSAGLTGALALMNVTCPYLP